MASDINEVAKLFAKHVGETRDHSVGQFRANALVSVATLSLLIEAGLITEAAAIDRIGKIASTFPEHFKDEKVEPKIGFLIGLLKNDPPAPTFLGERTRQMKKESGKSLTVSRQVVIRNQVKLADDPTLLPPDQRQAGAIGTTDERQT